MNFQQSGNMDRIGVPCYHLGIAGSRIYACRTERSDRMWH